jgi:hypothetical protein
MGTSSVIPVISTILGKLPSTEFDGTANIRHYNYKDYIIKKHQTDSKTYIVAYNSLAWNRKEYLSVYTDTVNVYVTNSSNNIIPIQVKYASFLLR